MLGKRKLLKSFLFLDKIKLKSSLLIKHVWIVYWKFDHKNAFNNKTVSRNSKLFQNLNKLLKKRQNKSQQSY